MTGFELRDCQIDIIKKVTASLHPIIPLPTGSGKTIIAAAVIDDAVKADQHVIFVVHRRELVIQASEKLLGNGVDVDRMLCPHPESGKVDARILDHSGAVYRHGYPDDEIDWVLSPDEKAVNQSEVTRAGGHRRELTSCPRCDAVRMEGEGCRVCGWSPETRPLYLEVGDGELGRVERDRGAPTSTQWSTAEQLAFYRQLMWIARQRQYRDGWAAHMFRERCGRFPRWKWNRAEPAPPGGAVTAWVRSRNIAYAKAMGASR
jgi:hypothetical protein